MTHLVWFSEADADLAAATSLRDNGFYPQSVWLCTQAAEKAHKALLFALGLNVTEEHLKKFGHTMTAIAGLLPVELQEPKDPAIAGHVTSLDSFVATSRYPRRAAGSWTGPGSLHNQAGATDAVVSATALVAWCRERSLRCLAARQHLLPTSPPP